MLSRVANSERNVVAQTELVSMSVPEPRSQLGAGSGGCFSSAPRPKEPLYLASH